MIDWNALFVGSVLMLLFAILLWPERGLYFRWRNRRLLDSRETIEDALMHVHQHQQEGQPATTESLAEGLGISIKNASRLVRRMETKGLLSVNQDEVRLTRDGRRNGVAYRRDTPTRAPPRAYAQPRGSGQARCRFGLPCL
jgi:hypothetical protein